MQRVCQRGALVKMSQGISQLRGTGKQGTAECHDYQYPCRHDQDVKQRTTATTSMAGKLLWNWHRPLTVESATQDARRFTEAITFAGGCDGTDDQIQVVLIRRDFEQFEVLVELAERKSESGE